MSWDVILVLGILLVTVGLFVSDLLRLDVVALLALLALSLTGLLTPGEALAGFSDPVVIMIAGLFVVGDGLFQTGVARAMGRLPARLAGDSDLRLLVVIMLLVAILSGFMSSTGTVAVMLPVVMGLAVDRGISPSRLLIPLSVASLLGGMLTLIGTAPNIVVANHLESLGREPFRMFTFTPVGMVMVVVGVAFMAVVGRFLLPDRKSPSLGGNQWDTTVSELAESYDIAGELAVLEVPAEASIVGRTLRELDLPGRFGVTVVSVGVRHEGGGRRLRRPRGAEGLQQGDAGRRAHRREERSAGPETVLAAGDVLHVTGPPEGMEALVRGEKLTFSRAPGQGAELPEEVGLVEVVLTPRSRLIGTSLRAAAFRQKFGVIVLSVRRLGQPLEGDYRARTLRFGDTLLVKGPWDRIRLLQGEFRDFVVAGRPHELEEAFRPYGRAPLAVVVMVGMMILLATGLVPAVHAVLLAAVAMVLGGAVGVEDAYRSINWESVILIAAILPMATALEKTGAMALLVDAMTRSTAGAGPLLLLGILFVVTSGMSQVISNTATAVLLAPLAVGVAAGMELAPEPFLMGIAMAASTAFATPIASPVNTLVLGPGGYRFGDFFKVGVALQLVMLVVALLVIPIFFPFESL
ncbi:MAG: SLC13 family permease [Gemmatimonadota bacterium]